MGLIGIILLVIMVISAVLLVLVVLVQDDQGEGIGGIFGGGSNTAFGSRSGNVLTRFTAVMAAVFLFTVFGMAWLNRTPTAGNVLSKARQEALNSATNQSWWVQAPPRELPRRRPRPRWAGPGRWQFPCGTRPGGTAPGAATPTSGAGGAAAAPTPSSAPAAPTGGR